MDLLHFEQRDVVDMVADAGYNLETHKNIETKDGYILTLHRIPHAKNANGLQNVKRHPVLLIHGMLGCTGHFLLPGPNDSLPYLLAESGFDVWMGNVRGVIYSREHVSLNYQKDVEYWEFSMHEMGVYDLPAMIDYILQVNGSQQVHYVGFSQGSVIFFIMCSDRPEYVKKISFCAGLSPLVYVKGATHPWLPILSKFERQLQFLTRTMKWCGVRFGILRRYEHLITSHSICQYLIKTLIYSTFGTRFYKIKNEHLGILMKFFQGLNFHSLFHAMQIFNKSQFIQYDYGAKKNLDVYGSETVSEYKVENVTCPVALYYSDQDWFMPGENAVLLASKLPRVLGAFKIDSQDFSHFDFLIAEEAIEKLYKPLVKLMKDLPNEEFEVSASSSTTSCKTDQ